MSYGNQKSSIKTLTCKKLYPDRTSSAGKGLFAKVDLKKGDLIFIWKGVKKQGKYPWYVGHRWLQIEKCQWISPFRNNPGWYINHSCNPNCGIKDSIKIVAMKNISKGEEVTIDYSTSESENGWYLICHCENKNCRRIIRSYEFLPNKLKQKYRDFISEYLKSSSMCANLDDNNWELTAISTMEDEK